MRPALAWILLIALPAVARPSSASVNAPAVPDRQLVRSGSSLQSGPGDLVLVLPLAADEQAATEWIGEGAARYLAEAVQLAGFRVVDEADRRAATHEVGLARAPRVPRASALVLARQLGARYVITGGWTERRGILQLRVRALDAVSLSLVREAEAQGSAPERVLDELAAQLIGEAGRAAGVRRGLTALARTSPAALGGWMQAAAEQQQQLEHLEEALALAPGFEPARLARAEALLDAGRFEQVGSLLEGLAQSEARHRRAHAQLLEGRLALALGDQDQAVRSLTAAVHELPETGTLLWLAEAQLASGDSEGAGRTVQRALAQAPSDEAALELLARARREGARF